MNITLKANLDTYPAILQTAKDTCIKQNLYLSVTGLDIHITDTIQSENIPVKGYTSDYENYINNMAQCHDTRAIYLATKYNDIVINKTIESLFNYVNQHYKEV